ncbi:hypothetical protein K6Y31_05920 [Motilimonas cestriensis]|uniref:Uncharacterized protein n=1 Tax=Motilimonas cestriensis TaxID=2742685 RepID=A0ABS8W7J8_9GAMM|nr:hypothetical protein [Motilimonas cestriensis]MCE2594347.1 hypothetical protein [Motilimonas cestriensis]
MNSLPTNYITTFIIPPPGIANMLSFLRSDDYNQRVKELAYQELAIKYGINRNQADQLCQQNSEL